MLAKSQHRWRDAAARPQWLYPRAGALAGLLLSVTVAILGERAINPRVFDPGAYYWLAENMWELMFQRGFIPVYNDRWIPSFAARIAVTLAGQPAATGPLTVYFELQNIAVFAAAGWLWGKIAASLNLSLKGLWIGFILLFVNFFGLKYLNWLLALTDGPCFLFSLGLLWAFLNNRLGWLVLFGTLGSFTFPGFNMMTAALIAFPRRPILPISGETQTVWSWYGRQSLIAKSNLVLATLAAIAIIALDTWIVVHIGLKVEDGFLDSSMAQLAWLSITIAAGYIFFATLYLGDGQWWTQLWTPPRVRVLLAIGFLVAQNLIRIWLTRTGDYNQIEKALCDPCDQTMWHAPVLFIRGIQRPAEFLVAQMVYWGLAIPLLLGYWPEVASRIREQGLGFILVVALGVLLGFDKVARHSTQVYPFLVVLLALTLDQRRPATWMIWLLATLNVAMSHVWYPMNRPGVRAGDAWQQADTEQALAGAVLGHPWWTDGRLYFALLGVLAALVLVCWLMTVRRRASRST